MKVVKESDKVIQGKGFGMSWACGHEQHALDKHDRNTQDLKTELNAVWLRFFLVPARTVHSPSVWAQVLGLIHKI